MIGGVLGGGLQYSYINTSHLPPEAGGLDGSLLLRFNPGLVLTSG